MIDWCYQSLHDPLEIQIYGLAYHLPPAHYFSHLSAMPVFLFEISRHLSLRYIIKNKFPLPLHLIFTKYALQGALLAYKGALPLSSPSCESALEVQTAVDCQFAHPVKPPAVESSLVDIYELFYFSGVDSAAVLESVDVLAFVGGGFTLVAESLVGGVLSSLALAFSIEPVSLVYVFFQD